MNLRDIKKDIEWVIGSFIDDCSLFLAYNSAKDPSKVGDLIEDAFELNNNLRDKINHPAEGNKKAYYNEIIKELLVKVDELCEKLSAVVSE